MKTARTMAEQNVERSNIRSVEGEVFHGACVSNGSAIVGGEIKKNVLNPGDVKGIED